MKTKAIIITGPTASGKSGFAHDLARRINGAIINADSVQIYNGIENISASPFAAREISDEIDGVPYKLFSVLPLNEHISVADFRDMAASAMDEVIKQGKIPIFVGGTGYYINVLINGISNIPNIDESVRKRAREMVANDMNNVLKILGDNFDKTDPQRVARALEVFLQTGTHISKWQQQPRVGALVANAFKVLILPPRDVLIQRIAARIPKMIKSGAIDEARNIIANNQNPERAIGAYQLTKMLKGEMSEIDAIDNWTIKTNQYAKRQRTWFRGQYNADFEITRIPTDEDLDELIRRLGGF